MILALRRPGPQKHRNIGLLAEFMPAYRLSR